MIHPKVDATGPAFYEGIADELDLLAQSVRKHPNLNGHFAERLHELAQQLREDLGVVPTKKKFG